MDKDPANIIYTQTGVEGLDVIAPLWRKLNEHHMERASKFRTHFKQMTWEKRKPELVEKAQNGSLLVHLAKVNDTHIGYCVSTLSAKKEAELESIYIEKEYRKHHIGDKFMKTALAWMDAHGAVKKIIGVAVGNEEALGFYEKYGFYPRVHVLQQADTK